MLVVLSPSFAKPFHICKEQACRRARGLRAFLVGDANCQVNHAPADSRGQENLPRPSPRRIVAATSWILLQYTAFTWSLGLIQTSLLMCTLASDHELLAACRSRKHSWCRRWKCKPLQACHLAQLQLGDLRTWEAVAKDTIAYPKTRKYEDPPHVRHLLHQARHELHFERRVSIWKELFRFSQNIVATLPLPRCRHWRLGRSACCSSRPCSLAPAAQQALHMQARACQSTWSPFIPLSDALQQDFGY